MRRMKKGHVFIGCFIVLALILLVNGQTANDNRKDGTFGALCDSNSDCILGYGNVCLKGRCACDSSFVHDRHEQRCKKICRGSKEGLVKHGDEKSQYKLYKSRYTNCSYVSRNLEITNLEDTYDLGFLKDIEDVHGYVLIVNVFSHYLNLTKLRVIRGQELHAYKGGNYSLYLALNHNPKNDSQGLLELQFNSLSDILKGNVYFKNNNLLCFANTIKWEDINYSTIPAVTFDFDSPNFKRQCMSCPTECYDPRTNDSHCWGSGSGMCQKLNYIKEVCHVRCQGRCFGPGREQCCDDDCAVGCTGERKADCLACKNFYNDGECEPFCPKMKVYDQSKLMWKQNPKGRYSFGSLCVQDCPSYLMKDVDACVITCPDGKQPDPETNICKECDKVCPKECDGVDDSDFLHSGNLHTFKGCTVVNKNLRILKVSFEGDKYMGYTGITMKDLEVLKDIREIYGYLSIQEAPSTVQNLSFLSGLETIYGRYLTTMGHALDIVKMNISYLGLMSLRTIGNGGVLIAMNTKLCYVDGINMTSLFSNRAQQLKLFKNNEMCESNGSQCDAQCSDHGCWGPGPDKCLKCKSVRVEDDNTCLASCLSRPLLYATLNNTCRQCNDMCATGCRGEEADECFDCKKVKVMGQNNSFKCMEACPTPASPPFLYADENRVCQKCNLACNEGCTGNSSFVITGGCKSCVLAINYTAENGMVKCLPRDQKNCPDGYYRQLFLSDVPHHPLSRKEVCEPCDELCLTCTAPGVSRCAKCRYFHHRIWNGRENCVESCPDTHYPKEKRCLPCHEQCFSSCSGPNFTDCHACKKYKVVLNKEKEFACVEECPEDLPHFVEDEDPDKPTSLTVCAGDDHPLVIAASKKSEEEERKKILTIVIPTTLGVLLLGSTLACGAFFWSRKARAKENTMKLTARMTGVVDEEPMTPTDAKPDLSKLRLIRESELRRGGIIGSGAFGTVYKGFWIPEGENIKIPVAIKVLQEGTSPNQNQELLEEARVMASVEHPCCIKILAICMASQMMLITQLMPLGCLLDYIKKHKDNTGSKALLNWCTQIARGMAYLEDRAIVHRDLAARNVLVQSAGQVKITDFGLAKLLDYNEEQYQAAGGKMPIKWLALECIKNRVFTHKSDVWSYGVTVWELFTYGSRPYENVRARDVPDLLEKGERLPQPAICTIDVYMIMIKCWMLDAESRPTFVELAEEFAKMARDPGRYLVIAGDELKKIPSEEVLDGPKLDNLDYVIAQGDKHMRLPSYSYDKDDLARHLSVAAEDGPEEVMEADDYLQPAPPVPMDGSENNNFKTPLLSPSDVTYGARRYGHLESEVAARHQRDMSPCYRIRGDSFNGRYSSDPVKYIRHRDAVDGPFTAPVKMPPMGNGAPSDYNPYIRQQEMIPPLDEDDYLQPKSANPKAYLELENSKDYYLNEKQMSQDPMDNYQIPQPVATMFENPEYFEGDPRDSVFSETKNVPRQLSDPRQNSDYRRSTNKPKIAPKPKRVTDYYNEIGDSNQTSRLPEETRLLSNSNSSNCSNGESAV